jgi:hypothetical protein
MSFTRRKRDPKKQTVKLLAKGGEKKTEDLQQKKQKTDRWTKKQHTINSAGNWASRPCPPRLRSKAAVQSEGVFPPHPGPWKSELTWAANNV